MAAPNTPLTFTELSKGVKVFDYNTCHVEFDETIGQGASMNVYEGTCIIDGVEKQVAFKFARQLANKTLKPKEVQRIFLDLDKEIKYMNRLRNIENVVQFYGLVRKGGDDSRLILVLELANCNLEEYLAQLNPADVNWDTNLNFCLQIAKGAHEMHRKSIIHGDIKGSNILVFEDKQRGTITLKLSDFGFSSSLSKPRGYTGRTIQFTAPEVLMKLENNLRGRYDDNPRHQLKDIYSYGLVVWQIAKKGEVPFVNLSNHEIEEKKTTEVFDDLLRDLPEDTPPDFREIINVTTRFNPYERERFPDLITRISGLLDLPVPLLSTPSEDISFNFEVEKTHYDRVKEVFEKNSNSERMLPDDETRLFEEYKAAINDNHQYAESCFYLARCYFDGVGTEQDYIKAFEYFLNAARGGVTQAQFMVGKSYEHGYGTDKNITEAAEWYSKAGEDGHPESADALKRIKSSQN